MIALSAVILILSLIALGWFVDEAVRNWRGGDADRQALKRAAKGELGKRR